MVDVVCRRASRRAGSMALKTLTSTPPSPACTDAMFKKRRPSLVDGNGSSPSQQESAHETPPGPASAPAQSRRTSFFGISSKDKSSDAGRPGGLFGRTVSRMSLAEGEGLGRPSGEQAGRAGGADQYEDSFGSHHSRLEGSRAGAPSTIGHSTAPSTTSVSDDPRRALQERQQSQLAQHQSQLSQPPQQQAGPNSLLASPKEPHPEITFALDLLALQPNKVYATSPPTLKFMIAAGADGKHPRSARLPAPFMRSGQTGAECSPHRNGPPGTPGNDWQEVWVELRGIILRQCSV